VVAVGEIGFDDQTEAEEEILCRQIELARAHGLPVLVHTPHRDKVRGTERTLAILREQRFPEEMALIDHNTEETLPLVLATGCWAGHSIYPNTKMDEARMAALVKRYGATRIIINSAADWGVSDPLKVPKTTEVMREAGIGLDDVERIVWHNPRAFFAQSGWLSLEAGPASIDQRRLHEGNSVLRGQVPVVTGAAAPTGSAVVS
jgi:predicted metal-dependent TIM-barrel fold hydrolase